MGGSEPLRPRKRFQAHLNDNPSASTSQSDIRTEVAPSVDLKFKVNSTIDTGADSESINNDPHGWYSSSSKGKGVNPDDMKHYFRDPNSPDSPNSSTGSRTPTISSTQGINIDSPWKERCSSNWEI
uniref:Uncharacterized protein n=1 Tax=Macrolepiota fuliginosa TaxID=201230 RepID=A0A5Q0N2X8_9AGAR|nr:hypothetical protein [Macrolepiota fuliginosa]QFZ98748.1 hypothetical protein [Macrolepiota fuliginosa]